MRDGTGYIAAWYWPASAAVHDRGNCGAERSERSGMTNSDLVAAKRAPRDVVTLLETLDFAGQKDETAQQ